MPHNGPYVITLEQIEDLAVRFDRADDWHVANWIRSQAQELQIEWERELNGSNDEQ